MSKNSRGKPGKPQQYTDEQLKDIALDVKYNKISGGKLTYNLLEKHTGISRNTFSRRIADYIKELNSPIIRPLELTDRDTVYFPNIDLLFEKWRGNEPRLIEELHEIEMLFYEVYNELQEYKKKAEDEGKTSETLTKLKEQMQSYKNKAEFYEKAYKNVVVSSTFVEKRQEMNISNKIINFKNNEEDTDLSNLNKKFEKVITNTDDAGKEKKADKFKSRFSNLFDKDNN
ncbi:hypothetical protein KM885_16235 [Oceanobacillus caeni]|uniref:hypothetical protein n=1 Tax=Oceanobacillus caeni TaxID=405946 RepID=UPI001C249D94|nr:hypothetical protein [Oceanobacillus caeni]MBU8792300.1 hypothetical protein [Oceanobacillus caeni]